jgi:hypothetical protein
MTTTPGTPGTGHRNPSFTTETCIVVACGTCHRAYDEDQDGMVVHFDTVDQAADTVTNAGWWVTPDTVQCPGCAGEQACAQLGHAWPARRDCRCGCTEGDPRIRDHTRPTKVRYCQSCQRVDETAT